MQRTLRILLLLAIISSTLIAPLHAAQAPRATSPSTTRPSTLQLSLTGEQPALKESARPEGVFTTFDTELSLSGEPGEPALPMVTQVVGIPSSAAPVVNIQTAEAQALSVLAHPLEPVPTQRPAEESFSATAQSSLQAGSAFEVVTEYIADAELYARDEWFPSNPVTVSEPTTLRGQTMVTVSFIPVQVNLATGALRWTPSADVTLSWAPETLAPPVEPVEDPYFESVFAATLSNYQEARAWRVPAQNPESGAQAETAPNGGTRWTINLKGVGLFAIPFSQLQAAGMPTTNPQRIAVYLGQQEQHVWISNNTLYLINQQEPGRWSEHVAYRLEILPSGTGKRMIELSSAPTQAGNAVTSVSYNLHLEEDRTYESKTTPDIYGEHWYWFHLKARRDRDDPTIIILDPIWETTFDLPHLAPGSNAVVSPEIGPKFNRCHYATATVNGSYSVSKGIQDTNSCLNVNNPDKWFDTSGFRKSVTVPPSGVRATGNTFRVELKAPNPQHEGADEMLVNSLNIRYQRKLELSLPSERELFFESDQTTGANFRVGGLGTGAVAFEVSTEGQPKRITGATVTANALTFGRPASTIADEEYLVATTAHARTIDSITQQQSHGLRSDLSQTDYLVIVPPEFAAAVQPLVQHRQSAAGGGLTTRVVTTDEIYSDFGTGQVDPAAIREFIKFGFNNWQGNKLSFVLLVGDATYDPLNNLGFQNIFLPLVQAGLPRAVASTQAQATDAWLMNPPRLWVPPMMEDKDLFLGEIPSDNGFVDALEPGDSPSDPVPDVHIGRLPANSAQQVADMVQKIVQYEANPVEGAWQRRILMVADDPEPVDRPGGGAGDFHALSNSIVPYLPERVEVVRAFMEQGDAGETVRDTVIDQLNNGAVIMQYVGHGEKTQWAYPGILTTRRQTGIGEYENDLDRMAPTNRLPLSLPWTCLEGYYIDPRVQSMAEEMVRMPNKGVIASFSPTGLDVATAHDHLAIGFFDALYDKDGQLGGPVTQLGPLTLHAKMNLYNDPRAANYRRLLDTYLLFGDPAMHLNVD